MAPILLTGARGYLGSAIGAALAQRGLAFAALPCRLESLETGALRGYRKVIHAAGAIRRHGDAAIEVANRQGTARLLAALAEAPPLLFISSRSVYGHRAPGHACRESDPPQPVDAYGRSKLAAEVAIGASGLPYSILRVPTLIGDSPAGIGHSFYAQVLRDFWAGQAVTRFVPDPWPDTLDVQALADLCARWAQDPGLPWPGIHNIAGPRRSLHETLAAFATVAARHGAQPRIIDRMAEPTPWPVLDDQRFRDAGGLLLQRSDEAIAEACWAVLQAGPETAR